MPIPRRDILLLGLLAVPHVLCGALASVASSDTSRDVYFAQQIASGSAFPLTGPVINGSFHLGPLWYYVLALPLLVIPNASAVTGWIGVLSASQFPLAYGLGTRLGDRHEGRLFALCLALPGWSITSFASLTHPSIVIPSLLFGVHCAIAYRDRPDLSRAVAYGFSMLLMCTAHPTTALPALVLTVWTGRRSPSSRAAAAHATIVVLIVAAGLAPMAYAQARLGYADLPSTLAYTSAEWSQPSVLEGLRLIHGVVANGPRYISQFCLELPRPLFRTLFCCYLGLLLLAAAGLVLRARTDLRIRRVALAMTAMLLMHSIFLAAIRIHMPPWMVLANCGMFAALVALGLRRFQASTPARWAGSLLLAVMFAWTTAAQVRLMSGPLEFPIMLPGPGKPGFMDVREYEDRMGRGRVARIPFRQLYALGSLLCEPVRLYGHYAFLVDYTYAVSAAATCGTTEHVRFGGDWRAGTAKEWVGLHRSVWAALHKTPDAWLGVLGVATPDRVWHSPVPLAPVVPTLVNFPRGIPDEVAQATFEIDIPGDSAVLLATRANRYANFDVLDASVDGQAIQPVWKDATTFVFRHPKTIGRTRHWIFAVHARIEYVDVVSFGTARRSSSHPGPEWH